MNVQEIIEAATNLGHMERREIAETLMAQDGYPCMILWGVDDIREGRPDLTWEQATEILQRVEYKHDASQGVTWDTLQYYTDEMYPEN